MIHLLIVILDDVKRLPALLHAWRAIGMPGVTILASAGAFRVTGLLSRAGLGMLDRLFESAEVRRRTLLVAVEDEKLLEQAIAEAERVMDGFDRPDSGLLLVLPVVQVRGLHKVRPKPREKEMVLAVRPEWVVRRDTPVEIAAEILKQEPAIVGPDTPLDEVARVMLAHPKVQVVCVVNEEGRLIGLLDIRDLADDLFFHILPEEFLSEITDLEGVGQFAQKMTMRTAADAMQKPVWVKRQETVKEAFKRMHEHRLPGLPVVDDLYHVVGYVDLLELMAACLECGAEERT